MGWLRPLCAHGKPGLRTQLVLEMLEDRVLLHGGESPVSLYLPPQHRLSNSTALLTHPMAGDPLQIALNYLHDHSAELALSPPELADAIVTSRYTDDPDGTTYIYLRQTHDGLEVMNADLSIGISGRGEVIYVASSFVAHPHVVAGSSERYLISAPQAYAALSDDLGLGLQSTPQIIRIESQTPTSVTLLTANGAAPAEVPAKLVYIPTSDGLELAWRFSFQTPDLEHWYDGFVNASTGETVHVNDRAAHAAYNVYALPTTSPSVGGRSLVTDPQEALASPFGWHDTDGIAGAEFTDTRGNNIWAQEDRDANDTGGFRPSGGASLNFNFPINLAQDPSSYQSAAITNVFYWTNVLHDIHYQYGFTEAAGNFQVNNYGRGGLGNDPVIVDVQDGADNATWQPTRFFGAPDGQSPHMLLSLYASTIPLRDPALDSDVFIHEYGHGVTRRLTGGPANNDSLDALQSAGMSEGWSDWYALMFTQLPTDAQMDAYPFGTYSLGQAPNGPGFRHYPYSFDMSVDPLTLNAFNGGFPNNELHKTGEIWCSALWDLNWLLITKYGYSSDLYHGTGGNNLALQLVMDGLKLQGANPSFLAARDAILAADVARTGGQNKAEIWTAFARRGMGFSASDGGNANAVTVAEAFDLPPLGAISGNVFRDDDGNGVRNGSEPGLAGWTVYRDTNNNGVLDFATTTTFQSTDTPKAITDPGITYSNLVISGLLGVITDINVTVNVDHPYDGQLYLTLLSPGNTPVILANYLGGSGDNYTNTTFDDEAAAAISTGLAPFTGSFRPYFDLGRLDGSSPNGTWKLRMDDSAAGNAGTLLSWSMQISYGGTEPSTVTDANGNYSFPNLADGTYHIREVSQPGFTPTAPASGSYDAVISGGQPVIGRNFGNQSVPQVGNSTTLEDTLSAAMLIAAAGNPGITYFRISGITGGTLFKSNGTTPVNNGDFLTVGEGQAGVRFLPSANSNAAGKFDAELSLDGATVIAGSGKATSTIAITPVGDTPQVANATVLEDTLSGVIVISRNANDGAEVSHFRISGIIGGTLFKNDGSTPISAGSFLTFTEGQAGVRFLPAANSTVAGHFDVESSQDGITVAAQSGKATSTMTITAVNDAPSFIKGGNQTVNAGAGPQSVGGWATTVASGPPDESGQTLTFIVTGNSNAALFIAGPSIAANGTLAYTSAANVSGAATITVALVDNGGIAYGGMDTSAPQNFTITVVDNNIAPVNTLPASFAGTEDTALPLAGLAVGDVDAGNGLVTVTLSVSHGTLAVSTFVGGGLTAAHVFHNGSAMIALTATLTRINATLAAVNGLLYTPTADFAGAATLTMFTNDNGNTGNPGPLADTDTATIAVQRLGGIVAVGPDTGNQAIVKVFDPETHEKLFQFNAYPEFLSFQGGVRVAVADMNGDHVPDTITVPGAGVVTEIRVFSGVDGSRLLGHPLDGVQPFGAAFTRGGFIAAGDVNGDSLGDVVAAPNRAGGGRVRFFNGQTGLEGFNFRPYSRRYVGGVQVAVGNVDTFAPGLDIVVAPTGPLPGSAHGASSVTRVRVYSSSGVALAGPARNWKPIAGYSKGFNLAVADLNGGGAEIILGTEKGAPRVLIVDGNTGVTMTLTNGTLGFGTTYMGPVRVAAGRADDNAIADLLTAPGNGGAPVLRAFENVLAAPLEVTDFQPQDGLNGFWIGADLG